MSAEVEEQIKPYYETKRFSLFEGDCRSVLPIFPDCYFDSIVTDPPYFLTNENGNGFMGKAWDSLSINGAVVDALFRSASIDLNTVGENTVPALANTTPPGNEISQTEDAPCAEPNSIAARRTLNQKTTSAQGLVITKQEALVLCGGLSPDHIGYIQSLPTSARLVMSDLSIALRGRNIARKLAAILLDDPVWLEPITTFSNTGSTERSVIGAKNGSSFVNRSTNETVINASDAQSIAGPNKSNVTTSSLTIFQKITARIISSPFATRAIRLCTTDPCLIPVLSEVFHRRWSREALRVLKPGGHLLAFAGTRTYHRLVAALEDEGFEIRDQIQWIYGSGFPKSLDVSKAIDAAAGAEREVLGRKRFADGTFARVTQNLGTGVFNDPESRQSNLTITAPSTDAAKQWQGFGTALKPAHEPIVLARKPLIGTVAENVLQHGTGGLNIDGCRIEPTGERLGGGSELPHTFQKPDGWDRPWMHDPEHAAAHAEKVTANVERATQLGRWPANVITDGSEEVLAGFPDAPGQQGDLNGHSKDRLSRGIFGDMKAARDAVARLDSGSAARFFYCAKATQDDRNEGCEDLPHRVSDDVHKRPRTELDDPRRHGVTPRQNNHPTVKPTNLMRYLCKLITPPGGLILDPFMGSGSTGKAAMLEGFRFVGIELSADYCALAQRRIDAVTKQGLLFA